MVSLWRSVFNPFTDAGLNVHLPKHLPLSRCPDSEIPSITGRQKHKAWTTAHENRNREPPVIRNMKPKPPGTRNVPDIKDPRINID